MSKETKAKKFAVEIKPEHKETRVGYNGSAKPLGDRTDLDALMDMALASGSKTLLNLFVAVPTAEEWKNHKEGVFLTDQPA